MKVKRIAKKVEYCLKRLPGTRDNDKLLQAEIWKRELIKQCRYPTEMNAMTFLNAYSHESVLSSAESIRRARQKLQEENPELRGKSYRRRHRKEEPEIREEIRTWGGSRSKS